jgi:phosphatidate phosphatase PAH1
MSVVGDRTGAHAIVDVIDPGTRLLVSDVDGTLTESENAEFGALLTGTLPDAQPDAAALYETFVARGYLPVYVTARAERLGQRTRDFLHAHGFPKGPVLTSYSHFGLSGDDAIAFKSGELGRLAKKGQLAWLFGNTVTDGAAFASTTVPASRRVLLGIDDPSGGRTIDGYASLRREVDALPAVCR